mgnify:CR=1 FL=1
MTRTELYIEEIALRILRRHNLEQTQPEKRLRLSEICAPSVTAEEDYGQMQTWAGINGKTFQKGLVIEGLVVINAEKGPRYQLHNSIVYIEDGNIPLSVLYQLPGRHLTDVIGIGSKQDLIENMRIKSASDGLIQRLELISNVHDIGWNGDADEEDRARQAAGTWPLPTPRP